MKRSSNGLIVLSFATAVAFHAACGSTSPEEPSTSTPSVGGKTVLAAGQRAAEDARVQAFLDARYTPADVSHSFHTKYGETIDCVDFFAQPGVKALAARGTPITQLPPPQPKPTTRGPLYDVEFHGQPDDEGNLRECPEASVPMVRVTAGAIEAAGGLDAFERIQHLKAPVVPGPKPSPANELTGFAHVTETFTGGSAVYVSVASMSVFDPPVPVNAITQPHSLAQTWTYSGTGFNIDGQTCTTNCIQSVEIGWEVDPVKYQTSSYPEGAHLFTFATTNGYTNGCYNNMGSDCVPFVLSPGTPMTPGVVLADGVAGEAQVEMFVEVANENYAGSSMPGWVLVWGNPQGSSYFVGYYPASSYSGNMQFTAQTFQVGGEVADASEFWVVPMGSGANPTAGYGQAAYFHDYEACSLSAPETSQPAAFPSGACSESFSVDAPTVPSAYTNSTTTAAESGAGWTDYFYYGNAPLLFWGQNYGYGWSPIGDWKVGSYKGECGLGQPITGVSQFTGGSAVPTADILCGTRTPTATTPTISTTGSECHTMTLSNEDNRADTDNGTDWDIGFYKVECAADEYVQGVAQSTSGVVDAVLCCPGNVTHSSCEPQVFYKKNSPAYSEADWAFGAYKGQCQAGQYVAGISTTANSSQTSHAILCCSP